MLPLHDMLFLSTFVCSTFYRAFSVTPLEKWPVPSTSPGRGLEHVAIELFQSPWLCCSLSCLRQRPRLFHDKDNPWTNRRQFFVVNLGKVLDMSTCCIFTVCVVECLLADRFDFIPQDHPTYTKLLRNGWKRPLCLCFKTTPLPWPPHVAMFQIGRAHV